MGTTEKCHICHTKYIFGQSAQNATFHTSIHDDMVGWLFFRFGLGPSIYIRKVDGVIMIIISFTRNKIPCAALQVLCNKNSPTRIEKRTFLKIK